MPQVLVVEDDHRYALALADWARREGFTVHSASTLAEARDHLVRQIPDLMLLDLELPDGSGLELLADRGAAPLSEIAVITGHASVETAVEALKLGAIDYLTKPVDRTRLRAVLNNVSRTRALKEEIGNLRGELRRLGRFGRLVGSSPAMQRVYDLIAKVAPTDATVLVVGESGTGKEVVASTVHDLSNRRHEPYLPINCGAISPNLIESELFGHERGSFTGADRRHSGYFERVSGGTLFLDEITEMPIELQVKLLRVLETGTIMRIGGSEPIPVDVRVLAASNRDPEEAVSDGRLREDLLYRLAVFPISLPPLRDRKGDIELLSEYFVELQNKGREKPKRLTSEALDELRERPWPGNVRELQNVIQRAFILSEGDIGPEALSGDGRDASAPAGSILQIRVGTGLAEIERRAILATLERFDGNKAKAADVLGISVKTLYNRLKEYRVS